MSANIRRGITTTCRLLTAATAAQRRRSAAEAFSTARPLSTRRYSSSIRLLTINLSTAKGTSRSSAGRDLIRCFYQNSSRQLSSTTSTSPSVQAANPPPPAAKFGPPKGGHALLHFGNTCALLSFSMTDVFLLRSLALVATTCGVVYNLTHSPPLRIPALWGMVFLAVNGTMILSLLFEDEEIAFSKEELELFEEHFLPYTLTPTQFRRLLSTAEWKDVPAGTALAVEGEPLDRLVLIARGKVAAFVNGVGAWIGEINFLDQEKKAKGAIATFVAESPVRYLCWEHKRLRGLLSEDTNLSRSVTHAINGALIGKLLSFTSHTKEANSEAYEEIMATVGSAGERDGRVLYKAALHESILHSFTIGAS
ncbi:Cyclic nucleotide-binding domain protein [Nannochloropsis gaditana]|uniref:Cyclic nucleotide-binding domain protein n=1 Tax=Nannochloropsis gaditana TaxID=72520 RepID=W7TIA1_9STRA|nr:Cyclic nucleotide-binding domain protein [Nannochloropsis gaditana]